MTTHDREVVIAAAIGCIEGPYDSSRAIIIVGNEIERLYAIAFEAGRQAEREECANVCEGQTEGFAATSAWDEAALSCAKAIRARTQCEN